jgi:hypothetical protein
MSLTQLNTTTVDAPRASDPRLASLQPDSSELEDEERAVRFEAMLSSGTSSPAAPTDSGAEINDKMRAFTTVRL